MVALLAAESHLRLSAVSLRGGSSSGAVFPGLCDPLVRNESRPVPLKQQRSSDATRAPPKPRERGHRPVLSSVRSGGPNMAGRCPDPFRIRRAIRRRKGFTARQGPRGGTRPAARASTITSDTGRQRSRTCGMAEATARAVADDLEVTRQDHA